MNERKANQLSKKSVMHIDLLRGSKRNAHTALTSQSAQSILPYLSAATHHALSILLYTRYVVESCHGKVYEKYCQVSVKQRTKSHARYFATHALIYTMVMLSIDTLLYVLRTVCQCAVPTGRANNPQWSRIQSPRTPNK